MASFSSIVPFPPVVSSPFITTMEILAPEYVDNDDPNFIKDADGIFGKPMAEWSINEIKTLQSKSPIILSRFLALSRDVQPENSKESVRLTSFQYFLVHCKQKHADILTYLAQERIYDFGEALTGLITLTSSSALEQKKIGYYILASTENDGDFLLRLSSILRKTFFFNVIPLKTKEEALRVFIRQYKSKPSSKFINAFKRCLKKQELNLNSEKYHPPHSVKSSCLQCFSPSKATVKDLDSQLDQKLKDEGKTKEILILNRLLEKPLTEWSLGELRKFVMLYKDLFALFLKKNYSDSSGFLTHLQYFLIHFIKEQKPILNFLIINCKETLIDALTDTSNLEESIIDLMARSSANDGTLFDCLPSLLVNVLTQDAISEETKASALKKITELDLTFKSSTTFMETFKKAFSELCPSKGVKRTHEEMQGNEVIKAIKKVNYTNYNSSPLKTNPELISRLNGLIPGRPTNDVFGIFKYIFEKNLAMDVFCVREGNRANLFCPDFNAFFCNKLNMN